MRDFSLAEASPPVGVAPAAPYRRVPDREAFVAAVTVQAHPAIGAVLVSASAGRIHRGVARRDDREFRGFRPRCLHLCRQHRDAHCGPPPTRPVGRGGLLEHARRAAPAAGGLRAPLAVEQGPDRHPLPSPLSWRPGASHSAPRGSLAARVGPRSRPLSANRAQPRRNSPERTGSGRSTGKPRRSVPGLQTATLVTDKPVLPGRNTRRPVTPAARASRG